MCNGDVQGHLSPVSLTQVVNFTVVLLTPAVNLYVFETDVKTFIACLSFYRHNRGKTMLNVKNQTLLDFLTTHTKILASIILVDTGDKLLD